MPELAALLYLCLAPPVVFVLCVAGWMADAIKRGDV